MNVLAWIENNSTVFSFASNVAVALVVYYFYTRKKDKERLADEEPKIFVEFHWKWTEFERVGKSGLEPVCGRIEYLELSNAGKGLATNVEITVYGEREYPNFTDTIQIGRYTKEYLPPGHKGLYYRPSYIQPFGKGEYPQEFQISYVFRGQWFPQERTRIFPKRIEDRGYELREYNKEGDK
jgi:hypothetical protein